jgi:pSer/pThr/pTyr-binding forkhead associated (FHA) protein
MAADSTTATGSALELELRSPKRGQEHTLRLPADREYVIGRDELADVIIDDPALLPRHARLLPSPDGVSVEPLSDAAVAISGVLIKKRTQLQDGDWLVLGSSTFQVRLSGGAGALPTTSACGQDVVTFGRLADSTVQIDSPLVSREHARLEKANDRWILTDQGSTNGTFVNGQRLTKPRSLKAGDRIDIATFGFLFTGEGVRPIDAAAHGRVRVEVQDLSKQVQDRASGKPRFLLKDVSFVIDPGEFVAIFGTSGSGKSTLLDALSGRRAASGGHIRYNGTDLYGAFDRFRSTIGYVPQQDIVHRK